MSATASATVAASPTTSTSPSSSVRTPARNSAWSSTSTTRGMLAAEAEPESEEAAAVMACSAPG